MSTTMYFVWRNKKNISIFWLKKKKAPYLELCSAIIIKTTTFRQKKQKEVLTLVMLNKLRCHIHF